MKNKRMTSCWILAALLWAAQAWAGPQVAVETASVHFDAVPDGTHITRVFTVKNTGDEALKIVQILPP